MYLNKQVQLAIYKQSLSDVTLFASIFSFFVYIIWQTGIFFQVGFTLGNLNAFSIAANGAHCGFYFKHNWQHFHAD